MRISFIRHALSQANIENRVAGREDYALSDEGKKQATELKEHLPDSYDIVYSSPLLRCKQTAEIALPKTAEIITIEGLQEMDMGVFEGRLKSSLNEEDRQMWRRIETELEFNGHNGENLKQFTDRVISTFGLLVVSMQRNNYKHSLVFSHYGVITLILIVYLNLPVKRDEIDNASIYTIENVDDVLDSNGWKLVK